MVCDRFRFLYLSKLQWLDVTSHDRYNEIEGEANNRLIAEMVPFVELISTGNIMYNYTSHNMISRLLYKIKLHYVRIKLNLTTNHRKYYLC